MNAEYHDYGWEDKPTHSTSFIYPVVRQLLRYDKGKRILDMGCGNGDLTCLLLADGFDVVGIDASPSGIEIGNRKYPGRFFVHDVSKDELPAAVANVPFDLVVSTEVIEHLYDPRTYLALAQKTLRAKRGELIVTTPYHGYLKNLALALLDQMDEHYTALWDGGHIKFWSRRTLTVLLDECGFQVTDFRGAGRLPYLWKSMVVRASLRA